MRFGRLARAALAVGALGIATPMAIAAHGNGRAIDTDADYTPFTQFTPLAGSDPCTGAPSGRTAQPFVIPAGYEQPVVAEEGEPGTNVNTDN